MIIKRVLKFILITFILLILLTFSYKKMNKCEKCTKNYRKNVIKEQKISNNNEKNVKNDEIIENNEIKETENEYNNQISVSNDYFYRLTSYWTGDEYDTGGCTGSGLCENNFIINDKGWYTYNGYIVLAGATTYLQSRYGVKEGRHYFTYYDIISLNIDGINYKGIILDSCGASMYLEEERLDLFVSNSNSTIDRGYGGNNMIKVNY